MTAAFRFTDVGEGLDEGEIVAWFVNVGDTVIPYQPLLSVETDKSVVDLPSPFAGRVVALHGVPGDIVKVGSLLVEIAETPSDHVPTTAFAAPPNSSADADSSAPSAPTTASVSSPLDHTARSGPPVVSATTRVKASPATRKLAVELDVDLASIVSTAADQRITVDDVRAAAAASDTSAQPFAQTDREVGATPPLTARAIGESAGLRERATEVARTEGRSGIAHTAGRTDPIRSAVGPEGGFGTKPLRGLRRRIAEVMSQSWSTIPHVQAMDEIDATELLKARNRLRQQLTNEGPRLTVLSFAVKAAAIALRRYPMMNSSIDSAAGTFTLHAEVHIGLAVATSDGLVVPVLADADRRSLGSIAQEIERLSASARARTLTRGESHGGTFTITNYGSFGGTWGSPIIRPPEAGILGLGGIKPRPFVVDGKVKARETLPLVACADHRLVDGDVLGGFLMLVGGLLADPVRMLLED